MRIKLMLPGRILLDAEAKKITAPGNGGSFTLLPRHIDVAWTLEPGILAATLAEEEVFFAVDRGVLVKQGENVFVSCFQAIRGTSLETLHQTVEENFRHLDDSERTARSVLAKLETDTVRRFMELD